ncbi:hypothetical protein KSB_10120 [Ktedonobacter robiniae]|uniref:Uncharacterized protein n=1 Tax=Ktedonobacter robiniae TaxID=2778365 RepID=A0ABQ3UIK1_9CHLR|nr:hypothetical protein KSB_10120 [Ktedonobacter robiniae]
MWKTWRCAIWKIPRKCLSENLSAQALATVVALVFAYEESMLNVQLIVRLHANWL